MPFDLIISLLFFNLFSSIDFSENYFGDKSFFSFSEHEFFLFSTGKTYSI